MLAVQECLSTVAVAYRGVQVDDKDIVIIEAMLLNNIAHVRKSKCISVNIFMSHHLFVCSY